MTTFKDFDLPAGLLQTLELMQYTTPTPIQEQTIPLALGQKKDILGSAQTGTGKTAAFGIPLIAQLMMSEKGSALILLPTRELAVQVLTVMKQMIRGQKGIKTALLIGGDPYPGQLRDLRERPRLVVGTPGRINDHLGRGTLKLSDTRFLVLDETDRMLDMGFGVQLDAILEFLPAERQTLMFSATLPNEIIKLSSKYLNDPVRIAVGSTNKPALNIKQETANVSEHDKYPLLVKELTAREGSIVVFVKTKRSADKTAEKLRQEGHKADSIHGDLRQTRRERNIRDFRNRKFRILVATDVAARGLDIEHIRHVINYDLPQCADDFIHRIGRTARNGAEGSALSFISRSEEGKWRAISRMLNPGSEPARDEMPHLKRRNSGGSYDKWGNRSNSSGGGSRKPRSFGDRPARRDDDRGPRRFDDRPARRDDDRPARRDDDRGPRRFDDRPARRDDDRGPRSFSDRPARRDDDRPARRDDDRGPRSFSDRPARRDDDRGPRRFDDRPPARRNDDRPARRFDGPSASAGRPERSRRDDEPRASRRFDDSPSGRSDRPKRFDEAKPQRRSESSRPTLKSRPAGPNAKAFQKRSDTRFKPNAA